MNNRNISCLVLTAACATLLAGCNESEAGDSQLQGRAETARAETAREGREVCTEETVTRKKPVKDKDRVVGTVAGAVVGGVVGDAVGGDLATVGGAVAGGYAGNRVQKEMHDDEKETIVERTCRTVYD